VRAVDDLHEGAARGQGGGQPVVGHQHGDVAGAGAGGVVQSPEQRGPQREHQQQRPGQQPDRHHRGGDHGEPRPQPHAQRSLESR